MDFELSDEQRLFQDSARKMVERHIRPELDSHDRNRPLPKEAMLRIFQVFSREGLTAPRLAVEDVVSLLSQPTARCNAVP
jgi:alkylation response protein AidB-like acyl-CoA dehydrogenase